MSNIPIKPIVLGRFGAAYGILGWIKVFSFTEYCKSILTYQPWFIKQSDNNWHRLELEKWKKSNQGFISKIKNINNRIDANKITNCEIIVDSVQLPILNDREYYWKDLIGCHVITINGYSLGYTKYLIETGANDVLVVKTKVQQPDILGFQEKERLVPFIDELVIKKVNLAKKEITVDWDPEF